MAKANIRIYLSIKPEIEKCPCGVKVDSCITNRVKEAFEQDNVHNRTWTPQSSADN